MERCPPEILSQIFSRACTDGGYTGRSLSAVSKYIHNTSKPYKYKSIGLHGVRKTSAFATLLGEISPDIPNGITHLFVSNNHESSTVEAYSEPPGTASLAASLRRHASSVSGLMLGSKRRRRRQKSEADIRRDMGNIGAILKVLRVVAPTLQTLTICFISKSHTLPFSDSATPNAPFPRLPALSELTLSYQAPVDGGFNYHFFCSSASAASFPSLKRLDISAQSMSHHLPQTLYYHIATIAPSLTHLCLPSHMSLELRGALFDGDDEYKLPPALRRICILLDVRHHCSLGSDQSNCFHCQIMSLATMDPRIIILDGEISYEDATGDKRRETLIDEWHERMNGSEVFWEAGE